MEDLTAEDYLKKLLRKIPITRFSEKEMPEISRLSMKTGMRESIAGILIFHLIHHLQNIWFTYIRNAQYIVRDKQFISKESSAVMMMPLSYCLMKKKLKFQYKIAGIRKFLRKESRSIKTAALTENYNYQKARLWENIFCKLILLLKTAVKPIIYILRISLWRNIANRTSSLILSLKKNPTSMAKKPSLI